MNAFRTIKNLTYASALVITTIGVVPQARADEWNKETVMTISEPLQLPNKLLEPGKYVMKLVDSQSDRHIVQVYNADKTQLITTILAIPNRRLQPTGKTAFSFWETPAGQPAALRAWFYPGDNFGQEFAYPKQMASQISAYNKTEVPVNNDVDTNSSTATTETQQSASTQSQAENTAPPANATTTPDLSASNSTNNGDADRTNNDVDRANNSDADRAAVAPEPTPAPAPQPTTSAAMEPPPAAPMTTDASPAPAPQANTSTELPRTGSIYPLIGFTGLLFVIGFAVLTLAGKVRA